MAGSRRLFSLVAVAAALGLAGCSERSGHDRFALMEGQGIYKAECAACHGVALEGQASWPTPGPDGQRPATPLNARGPSWQQPREQLAAMVKRGRVAPPSAPDQTLAADTHAFAGKLTDAQIDNVLAWIETQWPAEVLKQRAALLPPK